MNESIINLLINRQSINPSIITQSFIQSTNQPLKNGMIHTRERFWGSKELKDKYFPKLCSGSVTSFCLSEVGSGSDAFSLSTKATASPDGSYYTIEVGRARTVVVVRGNDFGGAN